MSQPDFKMIATTMFGLEDVLSDELLKLGARSIEKLNRSVSFEGDKGFLYKANLCLRTALRVLKPIASFTANKELLLYNNIKEIPWETYLEVTDTLAIDAILNSEYFTHSQFIAQKAKDAIVDRFREQTGQRPSVDLEHPSLRIVVHIFKDICTISLDSSGESLHKRGYRDQTNLAPLNEVMAAGLVLLSGWDKRSNFIDPMCGSGTIAIEAALIAAGIPPGYYRKEYAFENWKDFDKALFDTIYEAMVSRINDSAVSILATDISANVLKKAKQNIKDARVEDLIQTGVSAFQDLDKPQGPGVIIMNPPYGERMDKDDSNALYKNIGDTLKKKWSGYTAWIITSNFEAINHIGLKPTRRITLYNGSLECKFLKYEMYEGTKKIHKIQKEQA